MLVSSAKKLLSTKIYKIYNKGPDTEPHIVKVISDTVGLFCIVYIWSCRYDEKHLFTTPQKPK